VLPTYIDMIAKSNGDGLQILKALRVVRLFKLFRWGCTSLIQFYTQLESNWFQPLTCELEIQQFQSLVSKFNLCRYIPAVSGLHHACGGD
jgi:hypothetical protein